VRILAQQVYGFFDSGVDDERDYAENDMAKALRMVGGDGVAALGENLRVVSAQDGLHSRVLFGGAMVRGYYYGLQDDGGGPFVLAHAAAPSLPRIDRVVLRLDTSAGARNIQLAVKQGVESASPMPPALQRDDTIYELSLARVHVATGAGILTDDDIVDERDDEELCGILAPARVEQLLSKLNASSIMTSSGLTIQQELDTNLSFATQAEAQAGTSANRVMSPQRVRQSLGATGAVQTMFPAPEIADMSWVCGLGPTGHAGGGKIATTAQLRARMDINATWVVLLPAAGWFESGGWWYMDRPHNNFQTAGFAYVAGPVESSWDAQWWARHLVILQQVTAGNGRFMAMSKPPNDFSARILRTRIG